MEGGMNMPDLVVVSGVQISFGKTYALRGLSIRVPAGQTYGLLGPNGAGKTTLIRLIAGLLHTDTGTVSVLDTPMPNKAILSKIGYMTQAAALYTDLTIRENITFFGTIMGGTTATRVDEVMALVDLSDRADSLVGTLSGGMKQRTSLACALVHKPRLLLLDEPTVGVDPQLRVQFWAHFRKLNEEGITIIVSSHVMDEAERCDRLGFIQGGRLLAEGDAVSLLKQAGATTLEEAFIRFAERVSS
jgi:ABC-2 type transport system ATP-binding protein